MRYERIDLSWLPRPEVVVRGLRLSAPGKVQGTVRAVSLVPRLLPLLGGRVLFARAVVEGPELTVEIPEPDGSKEPPSRDPLEAVRSLVRGGRSLVVELHEGRARFVRRGTTVAAVSGLGVRIGLSARGRALHGDVRADARAVSLERGPRRSLAIDGLSVEGSVDSGDGRTEITLARLFAESPRLTVAAAFRADGAAPRADLSARGSDLDVTGLREKLLAFAGDVPTVGAVFAILRGGELPSFSLAVSGETPRDLGAFERMSIRASLVDGRVRVEGPGLDFRAASGEVSIEGGVLSAAIGGAEVGRTEVRDGTLLVGLGRNDDRLQVRGRVRADLADVPGFLSRALGDRSLLEELALVEDLKGTASGRIEVEGRGRNLNVTVSLSEMRLSARYRRIPWPVRIDRGSFFFDGARVGVSRLDGSVGTSRLSGVEARVRLGGPAVIEKAAGTVEASLGELHAGIGSGEGTTSAGTAIRKVTGSARLSVARLSGPFTRPRDWVFEAAGTYRDLVLDAASLPGPVTASSGTIGIDEETLRVTGLDARALDAVLRVSGTVRGYRETSRTIEATADGEAGPETVRWVWGRETLPVDLLPTAPISLRGVRLRLAASRELALTGTFGVARGAEVALDLASGPDGTDVSNLSIADGGATASMAFRHRGKTREVRFQGRLDGATVSKVLAGRPEARGRIEGDFRALLPEEGVGKATAEGTLSVADVEVPTRAGPLTVERLAVRGEGSRLEVAPSTIVLDGQRFSTSGSAAFRGDEVHLDLDVATGDLAWPTVERVVERMKGPAAAPTDPVETPAATGGEGSPSPVPAVSGALRVSLDSFRYGELTWRPVLLDVRLGGSSAPPTAIVRKAEICGISTTGRAELLRDGTMAVDATVVSAGPDVGVPAACLGFGEAGMTGRYEASLRADGTGEPSQLLASARGPLTFKAAEGRLGKVGVLTRILGVLNGTEVFAGREGGRVGEAMAFRELSIEGSLGDGGLSIREATLKTPSFAMVGSGRVGVPDGSLDLMVLSQPLSTVDKVVQAIPVVRDVLGKDFLSVAAKVTGTLDDPKVGVSPAKDVGLGLVHILERTVRLPVTVFDPPPPREPPR